MIYNYIFIILNLQDIWYLWYMISKDTGTVEVNNLDLNKN